MVQRIWVAHQYNLIRMKELIKVIQERLIAASTPGARAATRKFVPGSARVYGVRMPFLNQLAREYKGGGFVLVKELWRSGTYEERVLAAKMLGKVCKQNPVLALTLAAQFSKDISDWAVCDAMGMQALKPVAGSMREEIFQLAEKLVSAENPWQRRYALVLVEVFSKDPAAHKRIKQLIKQLQDEEEYYVLKAVAWLKRNLSKGK